MSVGNTKDNGNKGNNFPYQRSVLKLLNTISTTPLCCPTAATEATLQAILGSLVAGQAFQQALVTDTGGASCPDCPTYLEVRVWNGTGFDAPIYYDAAGVVVVPVGPVEYINPQYVLENIQLLLEAQNQATVRTPAILIATAAGNVTAGKKSVSFFNAGSADATVAGVILGPGQTVGWSVNDRFETLAAIAYDGSGTSLLITTLV